MISKKRSQTVNDSNLQRVIDKIYDDMNELIDAVNQGSTVEDKDEFSGKEGDIRVIKDNDGVGYEIQCRTSDGWAFAQAKLKSN
jgi:hypothetical protein|tara:strand:- start:92 stop:343 length:252 start_codon:yes stop_codon:yes gene_type:complete